MTELTGGDLLMRTAQQAKEEGLGGLPASAHEMVIEMLFDIFGGTPTSRPRRVEALTEPLDEVEQALVGVIVMTLSAARVMNVSDETFVEIARIGVQLALRLPAYRAA